MKLVISVAVLFQLVYTDEPLKCPEKYIYLNSTSMCYKFEYTGPYSVSANAASRLCKLYPGGNLATIPNEQVNSFVKSIIPRERNQDAAFGLKCANITSDGDKSSCKWDDGTPFSYDAFLTADVYDESKPGNIGHYAQPKVGSSRSDYGNGCCDFNKGSWLYCWNCDYLHFDSFVCQAPMQ